MPTTVESVRGTTVPRELVLRLALGQAVETLAMLETTGILPPKGDETLRKVARELRLPVDANTHQRQSLGDTAKQVEVFLVASEALNPESVADLLGQLEELARELDQIADGVPPSETELGSLIDSLADLRHAVAAIRAQVPDEVTKVLF